MNVDGMMFPSAYDRDRPELGRHDWPDGGRVEECWWCGDYCPLEWRTNSDDKTGWTCKPCHTGNGAA